MDQPVYRSYHIQAGHEPNFTPSNAIRLGRTKGTTSIHAGPLGSRTCSVSALVVGGIILWIVIHTQQTSTHRTEHRPLRSVARCPSCSPVSLGHQPCHLSPHHRPC
ncbi:hypothetical protein K443DRAFT_171547 [Laccaria amethystina LaAM-08-1]|uniref:Uncharacterized protein n=1 Tax=Laccaria amethystina LaAM-08-1 TaxID=1095629 RepID=A0A0C9XPG6_9AGAR|nr:hypothetical protein K443DRAFT_171547 [Laccaria amethystina LaAM-08-1]